MPSRPVSTLPGVISTATGLPYNDAQTNSFTITQYESFVDQNVIKFRGKREKTSTEDKTLIPNVLKVRDQLYMDETEITNLHWREFLHYIQRDSSREYYYQMLPIDSALRNDYVFDDFFRYYPVVGISQEQATHYLIWRSAVVNHHLEESGTKYRVLYRLPTESEWEHAASGGLEPSLFPFGVKVFFGQWNVNPKASGYLARMWNQADLEGNLNKKIKQFNKEHPSLPVFLVRHPSLPQFLQFNKPFYIYSSVANRFGLINMIGNVAEMVEEKGLAKGGSFHHDLSQSKIADRIFFDGPSPYVGLRAIAEVINIE